MVPAQRKVILTGEGYGATHLERLTAAGLLPVVVDSGGLSEVGHDAIGYVLGGDERVTLERLEAMPMLKAISFVGVGIGQFVDCAAAERQGVTLMSTPGLMAEAVAEHSLGFLLGLQRGLFQHNEAVKRGGLGLGETRSLADATIGIIGLGRIGLAVARRIRASSDGEILYWSRSRKEEAEATLDVSFASMADIFARSNSILVLLTSTPATHGIIGESLFEQIRAPIFLVNTAAAELVDPKALRTALDRGSVAAAAFDGYWKEPLPSPAEDPFGLLSYPDRKFIVTPHVAAKASNAWPRMIDTAVENLMLHFGGEYAD